VNGKIEYEAFLDRKAELTSKLADALALKLQEMGDDVRGITWFSSCAEEFAAARFKRAA
jgi:hypothetical protein